MIKDDYVENNAPLPNVILTQVIEYCNMQAASRGTSSAGTTTSSEHDLERLDGSFIKVEHATLP
jgi:hypothetical protein